MCLTSYPMRVEADFLEDLRLMLSGYIASEGFTMDGNASTETLLRYFLQIQHRRIERRVRRVEWSMDLRARETHLPESQRKAVHRIQDAIERGDDLTPYLSRQLSNDQAFKRNDLMLNDVGMHHLHLGEGVDWRGLINGTKELLFAIATDEVFYFVEVFDHDSFADDRPFLIAQSNWPALFQHAEIPDLAGPSYRLTLEQRKAIRKKHGNALMTGSGGTMFLPPGGGITFAGISVKVIVETDRLLALLAERQEWCKANGVTLANKIEAERGTRPQSIRLRLEGFEESGAIRVLEETARVRFILA